MQACPQMWFAATRSKRVGAPGGKESTPEVGPSTLMEELMPTVRQVDGQAVIVAPTDPHFPPWSLVCASQDPPVPFPLCAHCPPSLGLAPYSCLLCLHPPQTHRFFSLLLVSGLLGRCLLFKTRKMAGTCWDLRRGGNGCPFWQGRWSQGLALRLIPFLRGIRG